MPAVCLYREGVCACVYLDLAGSLDVIDGVESLLHRLPKSHNAMIPQHQHLHTMKTTLTQKTNTSVIISKICRSGKMSLWRALPMLVTTQQQQELKWISQMSCTSPLSIQKAQTSPHGGSRSTAWYLCIRFLCSCAAGSPYRLAPSFSAAPLCLPPPPWLHCSHNKLHPQQAEPHGREAGGRTSWLKPADSQLSVMDGQRCNSLIMWITGRAELDIDHVLSVWWELHRVYWTVQFSTWLTAAVAGVWRWSRQRTSGRAE